MREGCLTCLQEKIPVHNNYTGESSRSSYERMKTHNQDLDNGDNRSPLVQHGIEKTLWQETLICHDNY